MHNGLKGPVTRIVSAHPKSGKKTVCAAAFILEAFLRNLDCVFVLMYKTIPPLECLLSHHFVYVCVC